MTSPRYKTIASLAIDILILFIFPLILFIIFAGGFSVIFLGQDLSATSVFKPAGILFILFILKLLVADFQKEIEKTKQKLGLDPEKYLSQILKLHKNKLELENALKDFEISLLSKTKLYDFKNKALKDLTSSK